MGVTITAIVYTHLSDGSVVSAKDWCMNPQYRQSVTIKYQLVRVLHTSILIGVHDLSLCTIDCSQ